MGTEGIIGGCSDARYARQSSRSRVLPAAPQLVDFRSSQRSECATSHCRQHLHDLCGIGKLVGHRFQKDTSHHALAVRADATTLLHNFSIHHCSITAQSQSIRQYCVLHLHHLRAIEPYTVLVAIKTKTWRKGPVSTKWQQARVNTCLHEMIFTRNVCKGYGFWRAHLDEKRDRLHTHMQLQQ